MVIKFQCSVPDGEKVLIYDKHRVLYQQIENTHDLRGMFNGRLKFYAKCSIDKDGKLHIGKEVQANF